MSAQAAVEARLDVVEGLLSVPHGYSITLTHLTELVQSEDMFGDTRTALRALQDLDFDKLVASVMPSNRHISPDIQTHISRLQLAATESKVTNTASEASSRISQMLNLRSAMQGLPALRRALTSGKAELLRLTCHVRGQPSWTTNYY